MRTIGVFLVALLLAGCASLTPQQQTGLGEARAFLRAAAAAYDVWTPGLVVGSTAGEGAHYRQATILMNDRALTWRHRDALLAHEFAHYLLGHEADKLRGSPAQMQREWEERERQANIKAVEVLVRAKGIGQGEAIATMRRLLEAPTSGSRLAGHKSPAEELAEFRAAFPDVPSSPPAARRGDTPYR